MDYLVLYYDLFEHKYKYRVLGCVENADSFRKELLKNGIKTIYVYSLYNKYNLINKEK